MFFNRSGFTALSQILTKKRREAVFDKDKQAWLLIISSVSLLSNFLFIITPEVLKSGKI